MRGLITVRITSRSLRRPVILAAAVVLLHFLFVVAYFGMGWRSYTLRYIADLNKENTFGTWLSAVFLLAAAVVAGLLACRTDRTNRRGWLTIAAVLTVASVDEIATFHEIVGEVVRRSLDLGGVLLYAWVLPVGLVVAVLAASLLPFLVRLPRSIGRAMIIAGFIYVVGALGMELAEGWLDTRQLGNVGTAILTGAEEAMEMGGALLALSAMLDHAGGLRISILDREMVPVAEE